MLTDCRRGRGRFKIEDFTQIIKYTKKFLPIFLFKFPSKKASKCEFSITLRMR